MEEFDVIIVGAGPAGLSIGSELSKNHKILVIEKNKIGETNKKTKNNYKYNRDKNISIG
jgi:flavin-dependent dehydrogenase